MKHNQAELHPPFRHTQVEQKKIEDKLIPTTSRDVRLLDLVPSDLIANNSAERRQVVRNFEQIFVFDQLFIGEHPVLAGLRLHQ